MPKKQTPPGNEQEAIHARDYWSRFLEKDINAATFMEDHGRKKMSLNGPWHYAVDQYNTCLRASWYNHSFPGASGEKGPVDYDFDGWPVLELPVCWNMVDEKLFLYEGAMVFTRKFDVELFDDERVFLRIGGANYRCVVFLNDKLMGTHLGGSTDFYVELTRGLREQGNRLILVADNTRRDTHVPMDNTDWFNYGGVYRDIEVIITPRVFIRNYHLSLIPDGTFKNIYCSVQVSSGSPEENIPVEGEAVLVIEELGKSITIPVIKGTGEVRFKAEPELWSPDHPRLYDIRLSYNSDVITGKSGFREIRIRGTSIRLNGEDIFLKGISCHEESVKNGKALTGEEIRENMTIAKELGCNFMRLAHYPHSRESALAADELGILLWEEIPVYWAIDFTNPLTYRDAENQLKELVIRDRNRASVIIWSVGNENADTDPRLAFMGRLTACCRELDFARPVSAACLVNWREGVIDDRLAEHLDIIGINEYYGWYSPGIDNVEKLFHNSSINKPVIISETGAGARQGNHGPAEDFFTEEKQAAVYREQTAAVSKLPHIRGISPWILYDFRCPRRTNPLQNYYNLKGLLSADKTYRKPAFFVLQDFYSRMNVAGEEP